MGTFADFYNLRNALANFNGVADAIDGGLTVYWAGYTGGTANNYTASPSPAWTTSTAPTIRYLFLTIHATNTGPSTLNISGAGATNIRQYNTALVGGELVANCTYLFAYDGVNLQIVSPTSMPPLFVDPVNGRVGIGTSTPSTRLDVYGSDTIGTQANVALRVGLNLTSDLLLGSLNGNAPFIASQGASPLLLVVNSSERLKINPTGFQVFALGTGAGTHTMKYNNVTGAWTYDTSSERYKNKIQDSPYGLESVRKLKSRRFAYKDSAKTDIGFIAEEVLLVIPELVAKDALDQPDAVSYDRVTSVLCKAIQDLADENDSLKARLSLLESRLSVLEEKLASTPTA